MGHHRRGRDERSHPRDLRVLIRGAGGQASGIAHRLFRGHLRVALTEIGSFDTRPNARRRARTSQYGHRMPTTPFASAEPLVSTLFAALGLWCYSNARARPDAVTRRGGGSAKARVRRRNRAKKRGRCLRRTIDKFESLPRLKCRFATRAGIALANHCPRTSFASLSVSSTPRKSR